MGHDRDAALSLIRSNIERHGYHVYLIRGGATPDFCYTIGLSPRLGAELIIAGASYYSTSQWQDAIREISRTPERLDGRAVPRIVSASWGDFDLAPAHPSWAAQLALGAFDYYQHDVAVCALTPRGEARTIDVPDMTVQWRADSQPAWRWLGEKWPYDIDEGSSVVTNLRAMRGEPITEGLRRGENRWELFVDADPDQPQEGVFVVPFGTLLGVDPTLAPFTQLRVGEGLSRVPGHAWSPRRARQ